LKFKQFSNLAMRSIFTADTIAVRMRRIRAFPIQVMLRNPIMVEMQTYWIWVWVDSRNARIRLNRIRGSLVENWNQLSIWCPKASKRMQWIPRLLLSWISLIWIRCLSRWDSWNKILTSMSRPLTVLSPNWIKVVPSHDRVTQLGAAVEAFVNIQKTRKFWLLSVKEFILK
jgi:hypothetical protein